MNLVLYQTDCLKSSIIVSVLIEDLALGFGYSNDKCVSVYGTLLNTHYITVMIELLTKQGVLIATHPFLAFIARQKYKKLFCFVFFYIFGHIDKLVSAFVIAPVT